MCTIVAPRTPRGSNRILGADRIRVSLQNRLSYGFLLYCTSGVDQIYREQLTMKKAPIGNPLLKLNTTSELDSVHTPCT